MHPNTPKLLEDIRDAASFIQYDQFVLLTTGCILLTLGELDRLRQSSTTIKIISAFRRLKSDEKLK